MATWNDLVAEFNATPDPLREQWLVDGFTSALGNIGHELGGRNIIYYGSAFLQKQNVPGAAISITHEDINGFMATVNGLDRSKGLTLILHTPGGVTNATETIVSYLRQCFTSLEVIVPAFAMSAGTMISLASSRIIMAKHGQLGPIDPQMPLAGGATQSARAIVEQFDQAKAEISANPMAAHAWAPVTSSLGPALLQEASNALAYSEEIVANWLTEYMFEGHPNAQVRGQEVAHHFNDASRHKSHGRRIGVKEAEEQGLTVAKLEDSQPLQEAVLDAYHRMTIIFEQTMMTKIIWSSEGKSWMKNWTGVN
jgi:ATP-dependent protease ClpP protease subunit